jgi:hypothetical protein
VKGPDVLTLHSSPFTLHFTVAERIHLLVDRMEKELFRGIAAREGKSLSEWLRVAAHEKLAAAEVGRELDSVGALDAFFASCDRLERGAEPDWEVHRAIIDGTRALGAAPT